MERIAKNASAMPVDGSEHAGRDSVRDAFEKLANERACSLLAEPEDRLALSEVCARPELRPLLDGMQVCVSASLSLPFRVLDERVIELAREVVQQRALAAFCLRYALEIVMWRRVAHSQDARFPRWRTALWEMRAFAAATQSERYEYFQAVGLGVMQRLRANPHTRLVEALVGERTGEAIGRRWDDLPTIFTFLVHRADSTAPLTSAQARLVYARLNENIAPRLPATATARERSIAAKACHIGQPVRIERRGSEALGALRIAVGARFISRVKFGPTLGPDVRSRIAAQLGDADVVLEKIAVILRYWPALLDAQAR